MAGDGASAPAGPVRMCCVCRRRLPKAELLRHVAAGAEATDQEAGTGLVPDPKGTMPGRGLYVCAQDMCRERFLRRRTGRKKR